MSGYTAERPNRATLKNVYIISLIVVTFFLTWSVMTPERGLIATLAVVVTAGIITLAYREALTSYHKEDEGAPQEDDTSSSTVSASRGREQPVYERVKSMSGTQFEHFICQLLNAKGCNVEQIGGSGDQGADLIGELLGGHGVVQVKKRKGQSVSNSAVQEVYSAKDFYGAETAWVVTNQGFTPGARQAAERNGVQLFGWEDVKHWIADTGISP